MPVNLFGITRPHDAGFFVLAMLICVLAAVAVYRARSRMSGVGGLVRWTWILICGIEVGTGAWANHHLALASVRPGVAAAFDGGDVLLSLAVSLIGSTLAFGVVWTGRDPLRTVAGGLILAFSLVATDYIGFRAYHMAAQVEWDPLRIWLSVVVGSALAIASLGLGGRSKTLRAQAAGAALLVLCMVLTDFIAMTAQTAVADHAVTLSPKLIEPSTAATAAILLSFLTIAIAFGAAFIDDMSSHGALLRMRRLADAASEGIVVLTREGAINDCNAAFSALTGASVAELAGLRLMGDWLKLDADEIVYDRAFVGALVCTSGETIPVEAVCRPLLVDHDESAPPTVVVIRDLRERQAAEKRIRHLAEHDQLTGLPNRHALLAFLEKTATFNASHGGPALMLAIITVTNSKEINEMFGAAAGDAVLRKVAQRLARFTVDACFCARYGGADFAFTAFGDERSMEANIRHGSGAALLLHSKLVRPVEHEGCVIEPKVSIGLSALPYDSTTVSDLIVHAEAATERARRAGEVLGHFQAEIHNSQRERRQLVRDLRAAITDDQLVVYYQPLARAFDGEITGFEALVRWRHPEHGMMPPDTFISIAEENGLIGDLGDWVLQRACRDAAGWSRPLSVAVNLSPLQVGQSVLPSRVHEILLETGLSPARLELEVTESALFDNEQRALDVLRRLKALGLRVAMDDFGTGYSSLSSLHSFPFDKIKIDKSFVQGIGKLERSTVLVRAVLGLGRGLNIPVVAEGVETPEQLAFLKAENCAVVQGYLLGRPAPIADYADLVGAPQPTVTASSAMAAARG